MNSTHTILTYPQTHSLSRTFSQLLPQHTCTPPHIYSHTQHTHIQLLNTDRLTPSQNNTLSLTFTIPHAYFLHTLSLRLTVSQLHSHSHIVSPTHSLNRLTCNPYSPRLMLPTMHTVSHTQMLSHIFTQAYTHVLIPTSHTRSYAHICAPTWCS